MNSDEEDDCPMLVPFSEPQKDSKKVPGECHFLPKIQFKTFLTKRKIRGKTSRLQRNSFLKTVPQVELDR